MRSGARVLPWELISRFYIRAQFSRTSKLSLAKKASLKCYWQYFLGKCGGVFRTILSIYDGLFLQKYLTDLSRWLCSPNNSIRDVFIVFLIRLWNAPEGRIRGKKVLGNSTFKYAHWKMKECVLEVKIKER